MTINEILIFSKILAYVSGDRSITITDAEKKIAASALKRMADQRTDWTFPQKEQYKLWVDIVEQIS